METDVIAGLLICVIIGYGIFRYVNRDKKKRASGGSGGGGKGGNGRHVHKK